MLPCASLDLAQDDRGDDSSDTPAVDRQDLDRIGRRLFAVKAGQHRRMGTAVLWSCRLHALVTIRFRRQPHETAASMTPRSIGQPRQRHAGLAAQWGPARADHRLAWSAHQAVPGTALGDAGHHGTRRAAASLPGWEEAEDVSPAGESGLVTGPGPSHTKNRGRTPVGCDTHFAHGGEGHGAVGAVGALRRGRGRRRTARDLPRRSRSTSPIPLSWTRSRPACRSTPTTGC